MTEPVIEPAAAIPGQPADATGTVYLHIGLFKSGTSFIQGVLMRNHRRLQRHGVLFPTENGRWAAQVRAVRDVLKIKHPNPSHGAWQAMLDSIDHAPVDKFVVSMEFLSTGDDEGVRRVVGGLAPRQVEVVVTIRDLVRVIPSAWQSMIKQGHQWPFEEFVEAIMVGPGSHDGARRFWGHHDVQPIIDRWAEVVGRDHVTVVTVPPSGSPPSLLWERFAGILGVNASRYDITESKQSNFSLSYSDAELLRSVNIALNKDLSRKAAKHYSTRFLSNKVLRASSSDATASDRPVLTATAHAWAVDRSAQMIEGLRASGVRVVGDLEELQPGPARAVGPSEPADAYPARTAEIIAALVRRLAVVDQTMPDTEDPDEDGDGADPTDTTDD